MFARFVFRPVCLSLFHPVPLSLLICLSCLICAASLCLYSSSFSKVNTLCSPWLSHHHHLQHYHHHCFCSLLSLLKLLLLLLVSSEHRFFLFSLFLFFPLFIMHNNWPLFGQQQCLTAVEFQWGGEAKNRRTDWLTDWQTNTLHRRTERKVVSTDTAENSATRLKSPCSRHWRSQWLLSVCSTQVVGTTTHRANLGYFFPHSPLWRTLAYRHTHTHSSVYLQRFEEEEEEAENNHHRLETKASKRTNAVRSCISSSSSSPSVTGAMPDAAATCHRKGDDTRQRPVDPSWLAGWLAHTHRQTHTHTTRRNVLINWSSSVCATALQTTTTTTTTTTRLTVHRQLAVPLSLSLSFPVLDFLQSGGNNNDINNGSNSNSNSNFSLKPHAPIECTRRYDLQQQKSLPLPPLPSLPLNT